jgi:hypothetical protein
MGNAKNVPNDEKIDFMVRPSNEISDKIIKLNAEECVKQRAKISLNTTCIELIELGLRAKRL